MSKLLRKLTSFLLAACSCLAGGAGAEPAAASGPYRLIVGFPAGGALDALARSLAEELQVSLKETVIVENRPGASTRIAIETVKNAKPDGRTILLGATLPFFMFPMTYERLTYDFHRDFVSVAGLANVPSVVSTGASQPFKTVAEYVEWAKRNPAQASVGMTNLGGGLHFAVLGMARTIGVNLVPVSYKGGAPLATDIMGGHIPLATDALASQLELHRSGKIRILGVTGSQRVHWLPNVPTMKEAGFGSFERATNVYGAFVPAATPPAEVRKLESAFIGAVKTARVQARLDQLGLEPTGLPGAVMTRSIDEEQVYWAPFVKASGFKSDN